MQQEAVVAVVEKLDLVHRRPASDLELLLGRGCSRRSVGTAHGGRRSARAARRAVLSLLGGELVVARRVGDVLTVCRRD